MLGTSLLFANILRVVNVFFFFLIFFILGSKHTVSQVNGRKKEKMKEGKKGKKERDLNEFINFKKHFLSYHSKISCQYEYERKTSCKILPKRREIKVGFAVLYT